ncbi:DUF6626 family protein [Thalassotalea psychrophila]|uniref:DUF6626 family protein n=1 Tax=Thalassotalea psychrophila TaxID=3065647 RepID=A0ABY9TUK7_9GAMM|nr:DUF6626 family protein [Colwelliaceae bacterium SQ149]
MELNDVYKELRRNRLCRNGRDFSVRYLGKDRSYYSVIKATKTEPSVIVLMNLYFNLNKQADAVYDPNSPVINRIQRELNVLSASVMGAVEDRCK